MRNIRQGFQMAGHWLQFIVAIAFFALIGYCCTRGAVKVHDKAVERVAREVQAEEAIRFSEYRDNEFKEWQGMQIDFVAGK